MTTYSQGSSSSTGLASFRVACYKFRNSHAFPLRVIMSVIYFCFTAGLIISIISASFFTWLKLAHVILSFAHYLPYSPISQVSVFHILNIAWLSILQIGRGIQAGSRETDGYVGAKDIFKTRTTCCLKIKQGSKFTPGEFFPQPVGSRLLGIYETVGSQTTIIYSESIFEEPDC